VTAIKAIETWLATGRQPAGDAFPPALGFVPNYSPPPWPFD
jgi:hypothetical protein